MKTNSGVILFFLPILFFSVFVGCNEDEKKSETEISGKIIDHYKNEDSIFFSPGYIDEKFYQAPVLSAEIEEKTFSISTEVSYPHMYRVNLKSERNKIPFRGGIFFIDQDTRTIEVDSLGAGACSMVSGPTFKEYETRFLPFFFQNYDCKSKNISLFIHENAAEFDSSLWKYVKEYPNSFVGLWFLIQRINSEGRKILFDEILNSFSDKMKNEQLWQLTSGDLESIRIKEGYKFPSLELKNTNLEKEEMNIPEAKYTLIDYWFSTCKPCLKNFPKLKQLYNKFNSSGFEVMGISVDKSERIQDWKEVIEKKELSWIHYLDENGMEATKDKITFFPTTFLLNEKGEVIRKNITPDELEVFLEKNLALK